MDEPAFLEVSIVKGEEVLVLLIQTLYIVGHALGKVPDISGVELLCRESTVLVDAGEEETSIVDEAPFSLGFGKRCAKQ